MAVVLSKATTAVRTLFSKGFFHIFGSNAINRLIGFVTNIAIVWFLTKDEYGVFSYANSIYSICVLFTGFGLISGMLQFCLEERPETQKESIRSYALTRGVFADVGIAVGVILIGFFVALPIQEAGACLAAFGPLVILDYLFQYLSCVLRMSFENQRYAALQTANTVSYFIAACAGAYVGGIYGTVAGRYIAYGASIVLGLFFLKKTGIAIPFKLATSPFPKRDLWKYSVSTQVSASLNTLTFLLDVLLVGFFIQNAAVVATYKTATIIPEGLVFIPTSVITFALPYFVKHNRDGVWFRKKSSLLLGAGLGAYAAVSLVLIIGAPWIVGGLWGDGYLDAVAPFRILSLSFLFNAMRATCTNLLCAVRAIRENLVISCISLVANVSLCVLLIPAFGIAGAALAPLSVSVIAAVVAFTLLRKTVKNLPGV